MSEMKETIDDLRLRNEVLEDLLVDRRSAHNNPTTTDEVNSIDYESVYDEARSTTSAVPTGNAYADSPSTTTSYLLSLHESLRDDLTRITSVVSYLDHRISMAILDEGFRLRDKIGHLAAALNVVKCQVGWLMSPGSGSGSGSVSDGTTEGSTIPSSMSADTTAAAAAETAPSTSATTADEAIPAYSLGQEVTTEARDVQDHGRTHGDFSRRRPSEIALPGTKL